MITYVRQQDNYGCSVACLAMIAGMTYEEARQLWPGRNFNRNYGMSRTALDQMLAKLGYAVCRRYDTRIPFGDCHLVEVQSEKQFKAKGGWHSVVMDGLGNVYDPDDVGLFTLKDYYHVRCVAAVVKVPDIHEVQI